MTKAIKEATLEEYMTLLKEGNGTLNSNFVKECFGSDQDFDFEACDAFAKLAEGPAMEYIKEKIMNTPEATEGMMATVEAKAASQAEVAVVAAPVEAKEEEVGNPEEAVAVEATGTEEVS